MRYHGQGKNSISGLMALLVFGMFAVSVLLVLLLGAETYAGFTARDHQAYEERTCMQYLAGRVRQSENAEAASVTSLAGNAALVLEDTIDGEHYETWVYCYDGWIREYFTEAGGEIPEPEMGEPVLEARSLDLEIRDGLLTAWIATEEKTMELVLSLRGGSGVAA